jgi:hypothetical protein
MPLKKRAAAEKADAEAREQHTRFIAELEQEGYLKLPRGPSKPRPKKTSTKKKRLSRTAGTLPGSFVADNITGRETFPAWWEAAFRTFADIAESAGAATAIEVYEKVLSRARKALVVPKKKGRGADDPDLDIRALGCWQALRRQGKTAEEAVELIEPDPDKQEALLRRLQRLQRFFNQPYFRGDN